MTASTGRGAATAAAAGGPASSAASPAEAPATAVVEGPRANAEPSQPAVVGSAAQPVASADAQGMPARVAGDGSTVAPAASDTAVPVVPPATPAAAHESAPGVTFPVRPATTTASTQAPATAVGHASAADAGSIGGALFSLVLVVGLILGLGWLAKRMPGLQRGAGSSHLKVVASVALGPRDRAVVVDVGGTQLLLGVGQGGVRTLHTLDAPLPVAEASGAPSPFAQILAQHFGRKP